MRVVSSVDDFNANYGRYPSNITELATTINTNSHQPFLSNIETQKDGWGLSIIYETDGKTFRVISAGADGKFNTEDDISF